jgi:hypothetical protein
MSASRRAATPRDQQESAFTSILVSLVRRVPGARAAALVDFDGETVDYAGRLDPFTLKLAAAHWRIVLHQMEATGGPDVRWLWARAAGSSYLVNALPEGYALALVLGRGAGFGGWRRAVASCARDLGNEAGWSWRGTPPPPWFPVDAVTDSRRRPVAMHCGERERAVEVLGTVAGGLGRRERGWRVRFDSGVEATLVREPGGLWYSDEAPDGHKSPSARVSLEKAQEASHAGEVAAGKKPVDRQALPTIVRRPPRR